MQKPYILVLCIGGVVLLLSLFSPRDFLTRRLAGDLIAASDTFRAYEQLQLRTGVVSNTDYAEYLVLQQRGWISAVSAPCPPALSPPPCWDVTLTPSGADTLQRLVPPSEAQTQFFNIPTARREFVAVAGISKQGNIADVEFTWKWSPLNEVGAALYPGDTRYSSTVRLREFDDGWRVAPTTFRPGQGLDEALKNAEPAQ